MSKSKYLSRGPYHFVEYADPSTTYHKHVHDLISRVGAVSKIVRVPVGDYLSVHEVGCGEGLILHLLSGRLPLMLRDVRSSLSGNDADPDAVLMASMLVHAQVTLEKNIAKQHPNLAFSIVMFCDSLEHIESWREHVEWAARNANCVVIAVPSIKDRHAVNEFDAIAFDGLFNGWKVHHRATRHARHLTIWLRA